MKGRPSRDTSLDGRAPALLRSFRALLACAIASALILMVLPTAEAARKGPRKGDGGPVVMHGYLKKPDDAPTGVGNYRTFFIDSSNRRLYAKYDNKILEYDLDVFPVPKLVRTVQLETNLVGWLGPNQIAVDSGRKRAFYASGSSSIQVLDLKSLQVIEDISMDEAVAPGFSPAGITYSAKDKRYYLVGTLGADRVVVAAALDRNGQGIWKRPIPQCEKPLNTLGEGEFVARSINLPALYFACIRATELAPGEAGIVRLNVASKATDADATGAPIDFFPISGSYVSGRGVSGFAEMDYARERFYLLSQSTETPGAWVLDGRIGAWVGFIAATDETNTGLGLDQSNGHVYIKSGRDGKLILADGRATPVPQGTWLDFDPVAGRYPVDPKTHRAFVLTAVKTKYGDFGLIAVLEDRSPRARTARPPDYDGLTSNIPEGPKTQTNFSGGVNGYGLRAVVVGGHSGLIRALGEDQTGLRSGDRGFTAARVPSVDLRDIGASASAHVAVGDSNTQAELYERLGEDWKWPWTQVSCLDGSGEKLTEESPDTESGKASVICDLENEKVEARSSFGAVSAGDITVGSSSFSATITRDPDKGVHTQSHAIAETVKIATPQGTLTFDRVETTASTVAHGRPGTTKATWERILTGVELTDANGNVVQEAGRCSSSDKEESCKDLVADVNDLLMPRVRVELFRPDIVRTPKGAFAGVQQKDRDFYEGQTVYNQGTAFENESASRAVPGLQVTVFNDSTEKSRVVLQLAAVQANSIYTIAPEATFDSDPVPVIGGSDTPIGPTGGDLGVGSADIDLGLGGDIAAAPVGGVAPPTDLALTQPSGAVQGVLAVFVRSPGEGALVASLWLLFGGAGWSIWRRRSLLSVLGGSR